MSKALTEVSNFDDEIIVPEGTDSRAQAAEDVEAVGQGLANRTRWLKGQLDNVAHTNTDNTFDAAKIQTTGLIRASRLDARTGEVRGLTIKGGTNAEFQVTSAGDVVAHHIDPVAYIKVTGDLEMTGGDLKIPSTHRIKYAGGLGENIRRKVVPYYDMNYNLAQLLPPNPYLTADSGTAQIHVPARVPNGCTLVGFEVMHQQPSGDLNQFNVERVRVSGGWDISSGAVNPPDIEWPRGLAALTDNRPGSDTIVTMVPANNAVVDNENDTLWLNVSLRAGNVLFAVRVVFLDPGPRND